MNAEGTVVRILVDHREERCGVIDALRLMQGVEVELASLPTGDYCIAHRLLVDRKSLVDLSCRVLDRRGQPIPNLYAAGELAGVGGINGRAALEGTMLGPGLLMGRIAAREAVAQQRTEGKSPAANIAGAAPEKSPATKPTDPESLRAWREVLRQLMSEPRPGYLHFEKAHTVVLERNFDCVQCHRESSPLALTADQVDRHALIETCVICHRSVKE